MITKETRILGIDFASRGFGYAVLGRRRGLIDWGFARVWAKDKRECLARIEAMVDKLEPSVIVLGTIPTEERRRRTEERILMVTEYAQSRRIPVANVSHQTVRKVFARKSKQEIAVKIAELYPELAERLPRSREPWMAEQLGAHIFDAIALVVAATSGWLSRAQELE